MALDRSLETLAKSTVVDIKANAAAAVVAVRNVVYDHEKRLEALEARAQCADLDFNKRALGGTD